MITVGTFLNVIDRSGALKVQCIRFIDYRKSAVVGSKILVVVKQARPQRKKKKIPKKGELYKALLVKVAGSKNRLSGYCVKFPSSSVILLKKSDLSPASSRLAGGVSKDLRFSSAYSRILSMAFDVF